MTKQHVLPGVIAPDGSRLPRPVIVTLDAVGHVAEWHYLTGHEPPFTTPFPALLHLATLRLLPL